MATKDFHAPLYKREFTLVDVNGVPYDGTNPFPVSGGGGGGGGGAVTLAAASVSAGAYVLGSLVDGAIVTLGALGDAAVGDAAGSLNAHTRQIAKLLGAGISLGAGAAVIGAVTQSGAWTVTANAGSGTFGISAAALPLPAGAATEATLASVLTGTNKIPASPSTDRTTAAAPFSVRLSDGAAFISTLTVAGAKTSNGATPDANNIGALPAIATNLAPSYTEGRMVALSTDLVGSLRVVLPAISVVAGSGTFNVAGATSAGSAFTGPSIPIGFVGTAGTMRNGTAANSLNNTNGNDVFGVGNMLKDVTGGNFFNQAGDASGRTVVVGAVAAGSAIAGNPVLVGGSDGTNARAIATDTSGRSIVVGTQAINGGAAIGLPVYVVVATDAGGSLRNLKVAGTAGQSDVESNQLDLFVAAHKGSWGGTTWERDRNNVDVTLLASASRTTTQNSANITTYNARALYVCLDVTTPGTGSITLSINWICPASGKVINLLTGAAVTTTTTNVYKVGIGLTAAANAVGVDYLCRTITINVTANNANAVTYSVGYCLIAA
jgi:hypothetical protein